MKLALCFIICILSTVCKAGMIQLTQKPLLVGSCLQDLAADSDLTLYCPDAVPNTMPCVPTDRPGLCLATFTLASHHVSTDVMTSFSIQQGGNNLSTVTHSFMDVFDGMFNGAVTFG